MFCLSSRSPPDISTFDLVSLLGGATAPGGTSLQLKKPADEPVATLPGPTGASGATSDWTCLLQRPMETPRGCASLHRPLRI